MATFHLHAKHARLGKLANNLETHGEDDTVPGFTFPVDCELDREDLDGIMGRGFWSRVYVEKSLSPFGGFTMCEPMLVSWSWHKVRADFILEEGGESYLEREDCHVKGLELEFHQGGMTKAHFQLYVHPGGFGEQNLQLQRLQRQELGELVLTDGERTLKPSDRQQSLPLAGQQPQSTDAPAATAAEPEAATTH